MFNVVNTGENALHKAQVFYPDKAAGLPDALLTIA
jgi:hypothetical protein